jgi:hypothetical protein
VTESSRTARFPPDDLAPFSSGLAIGGGVALGASIIISPVSEIMRGGRQSAVSPSESGGTKEGIAGSMIPCTVRVALVHLFVDSPSRVNACNELTCGPDCRGGCTGIEIFCPN